MNVAYIKPSDLLFFCDAKVQLEQIITQLESIHYASCEHGEIEQFIKKEGDEV
jgi:predicted phosphatase